MNFTNRTRRIIASAVAIIVIISMVLSLALMGIQ